VSHTVFISYARRTSEHEARALHESLGIDAFLDTSNIPPGADLPNHLLEGLLEARAIVILADSTYFTRRYCVQEFTVALAPFRAAKEQRRGEDAERDALLPIVVGVPAGARPQELDRLPPIARNAAWPGTDQPVVLAALAREQSQQAARTIGERLSDLGVREDVRRNVRAGVGIPYPRNLAGTRSYPVEMRPSIGTELVDRATELWAVHDALATQRVDTSAAALTGSLEGGGGFGKTRLALEYLHRYGPDTYPGGLFWVDADVPPDRLEEQFLEIIEVLTGKSINRAAFREAGRNAHAELAKALHETPAETQILYVVDNVPEPEAGEAPKDLSTWCPGVGKVALLATSRASQAFAGSLNPMPIDVLPPSAAVELLTAGVSDKERIGMNDWGRAAEWVGCLPLALVLLNASLRKGALTPLELQSLVTSKRPAAELDKQMTAIRGAVPEGALRGIAEAFEHSFNRLPEDARDAAVLLAHLAPAPIPIAILEAFGGALAVASVRTALRDRSFLSPAKSGNVPILGLMHRVLADFLRSKASDEGAVWQEVCEALVGLLDFEESRDPQYWPRLTACLPHAQSVFDRLTDEGAHPPINPSLIVSLGLSTGILLSALGASAQARSTEDRVVRLATASLGEEHPTTLVSMNNLAYALRALGDRASARKLDERVLEVRRRTVGKEHPDTLYSMNNLAGTLFDQGDRASAQRLYEQVLEVRQRTLGKEHRNTLVSMDNLGRTLLDQGDLAGARKLHEQALEARRRTLGNEHPDTLISMNNLAAALGAQGDLAGARKLHEQVLEARRRTMGKEHPATLNALHNLGRTLLDQGDLAGARKLHEQALEARRRTLGNEHPDTLISMDHLGVTLRAQGDLAGARKLHEQALEARQRTLGNEHPDTLDSMNNLAISLKDQGDLAGARMLQEVVLDARRRTLGEEHPYTLVTMNNLGVTLRAQGDLAGARKLHEQALEARRRTLGNEHPDTLYSMDNLAGTLFDQGDRARAQKLFEQALEARRRTLGKEHPDTLHSMDNLAITLWAQGDLAGARMLQEVVLDARRRTLGKEHRNTLHSMDNLARTLSDLGDVEGSRGLAERAEEIRRRRERKEQSS
jgi:tetratricopeptide (TPR) repeat protein